MQRKLVGVPSTFGRHCSLQLACLGYIITLNYRRMTPFTTIPNLAFHIKFLLTCLVNNISNVISTNNFTIIELVGISNDNVMKDGD